MQRLFITCTFLILIAAGGAYAGFQSGLSRLEALKAASETKDEALSVRLSDLESTLLLLAADTADIRLGQESYAETQTSEKQALSEALEKLSGTVSVQKNELDTLAKTSDVSGLIAEWSPFVYDITCHFKKEGVTSQSSGSAVLEERNGGTRFITNRHVVETEGQALLDCELVQPNLDSEIVVQGEDIALSEDTDTAYGTLSATVSAMPQARKCAGVPDIGDRVIILGYPSIGAKESVTATEGILSGFDEDYYTTSAKIEKGNSGGAAIDVERDCFMGIPTLVFAGKIESLARILPVSSLE